MLCPCIFCVALLMYLFVLFVACLTVFVNCLVKHRLSEFNIRGLTKTKTMEVEKLMNDHTIIFLTETQQQLDTPIWNSS